jgi:hypothetical protein
MQTESLTTTNLSLPQVAHRLECLEQQVQLIQTRFPHQPIIPRFEFVLEINGETVWSGLDLPHQYEVLRQQYPEKELVISWRSSPEVWI